MSLNQDTGKVHYIARKQFSCETVSNLGWERLPQWRTAFSLFCSSPDVVLILTSTGSNPALILQIISSLTWLPGGVKVCKVHTVHSIKYFNNIINFNIALWILYLIKSILISLKNIVGACMSVRLSNITWKGLPTYYQRSQVLSISLSFN